ncbi:MAG TPA: hypothetical protein VLK22_03230 [Candidatus Udaeobacter sp.]|nr:hypothetical protein [Candidatus Udaeobacter sp.]
MLTHQFCFQAEDGSIICNAVKRNGKLVFAKSKWFRFFPRKKKNQAR